MKARKTHERFLEEMKAKYDDEYTILSEYKYAREHIRIRHNPCGNEYKVMPTNILRGFGCPNCRGKKISNALRKNTDKFDLQLSEKYDGKIKRIGEYSNARTKIMFKCKQCENVFETTPDCILRPNVKYGCPECAVENTANFNRKDTDVFDKQLEEKYDGKIMRVSEYINNATKIKFRCKSCDIEFETNPNFALDKKTVYCCPKCHDKLKEYKIVDIEKIRELVEEKAGCTLLTSVIKNNRSKVKIKCLCGEIFEVGVNKLMSRFQVRCKRCSGIMSNMEYEAKMLLDKMGIRYKQEYTHEELRSHNNGMMRFDFAILKDNGDISFFLELDGKQHFEPVKQFGGVDSFIETKKRDNIKDLFCKERDIKLLRIPYTQKRNLEKILLKELKI